MHRALPVIGWCRNLVFSLVIFAGAGVYVAQPATAQGLGDIVVAPTRVVFEGRKRSVTLSLLNSGSETGIYRVSIINMRMTETGQFERLEKGAPPGPGEKFAEKLIRYAPRQIELAAGQSQVIRILMRKPPELEAGEYRSHLLIQKIPSEGAGRSVETTPGADGISINLKVIPGVALPVIIRHGELSASATLSDMYVLGPDQNNGKPAISFRINRTGNSSVFGNLTATYFAPGKSEGIVVSRVNKLAVYTPNSSRSVAMGLTIPEKVKLESGGRILVTFQTPPQAGDKLIAEGSVEIP